MVEKIPERGNSTGRLEGGRNPLPLGNKERFWRKEGSLLGLQRVAWRNIMHLKKE